MSAVNSQSGNGSRSPNKAAGRRLSAVDTATSRRPTSAADRPEERVKVFLRVRPTKAEGETPGALKLKPDGKGIVLLRENASVSSNEFDFDRVLGPAATQSDVYQVAVRPIVEDVLNGYNGTLMAYGQTGAGKTYSLSSIAADAIGMIPRAAAEIFSHIEGDKSHEYSVYMSYVQLYMELIQDLLRPESENLQIRENEGGVFVSGVHQQEVSNITQCLHLLHLGDRNRTTAFTALNAHSSRSHAVVMLTVIKRRPVAGTGEAEIQRVKVGKLFLVDLAGSERLKKSKSTGLRATEAKSINLSLTTLGMCINARADPTSTHVPFRDSKLTRLLQDSLGGNAKTSLLVAACDAQEHADETLQSLQFGSRAMCVRIQAVVNERVDYKTLHAEMVAALQSQDQKSSLLEASLLQKDAQLEAVQAQLQHEQRENARQVEELRLERERMEADRQRLLQAQQAALAQEQQHKAALIQKLEARSQEAQDAAAQHEQQRQQLEAAVAAHKQQLEEAAAAAAEAARQHAAAVEAQQAAHAEECSRLAAQHAEQQAAVREQAEVALAAVRQELALTQQQLRGSREECRMLQEHHEQQLKELEADWSGKLQEAQEEGRRQVAAVSATLAARDSTISQLQHEVELRDRSAAQLSDTIDALEADKGELRQQLAAAMQQLEAAARRRQQLEGALVEEQHRVSHLQTQVEGYERSRMALAKSFFENKMRSDAAKIIQRHWREHRLRRMRQQQTEGYQALNNAKAMLGTLAQQHADLEQRRRANLAFSGQTLVGDNLDVLQDAVESIIAAFLLPAKDLKSIQRYQQKVGAYSSVPSSARQSMAHSHSHGLLTRTNTGAGADLIKAINPLAESLSRGASGRNTPREMGSGTDLQQLPAGSPLVRGGSSAALAAAAQQQRGGVLGKEGSVRAGLANFAGKMQHMMQMGGAGGGGAGHAADRLRRLSSGQYQQQQQQYHNHHY